jgi:predicted AlkP superfamily phosphohydrolase/phosphomutase
LKKSKVIILGIDALEHSLVMKWDMKIFKQKRFGKIKVPILEKHGEPVTAVVWASFITGKPPEETGITRFKEWNIHIISNIDQLAIKSGIKLKTRKKVGDLLKRIGFKRTAPSKKSYEGVGTIFSDFPNSKGISIPSYNEDEEVFKIRRKVILAFDDKGMRKSVVEKIYQMDCEKVDELCRYYLKKDLIMAHLYSLDVVQHLFFSRPKIIRESYEKMGSLIKNIENVISKRDLFMIISDHGQEDGLHTEYGFYSANKDIEAKSILEFRDIIKERALNY